MDIGPFRWIEPVLAQIIPILTIQQRADLHHPHIVIGIAEREPDNRLPTGDNENGASRQPKQRDDQQPTAGEKIGGCIRHGNRAPPVGRVHTDPALKRKTLPSCLVTERP